MEETSQKWKLNIEPFKDSGKVTHTKNVHNKAGFYVESTEESMKNVMSILKKMFSKVSIKSNFF